MSEITKSMCWEMVTVKRDSVNEVGAAIFKKPSSNDCYEGRMENNPPLCEEKDDPNAAWYLVADNLDLNYFFFFLINSLRVYNSNVLKMVFGCAGMFPCRHACTVFL